MELVQQTLGFIVAVDSSYLKHTYNLLVFLINVLLYFNNNRNMAAHTASTSLCANAQSTFSCLNQDILYDNTFIDVVL